MNNQKYQNEPDAFELVGLGLNECYLNLLPDQCPPSGSEEWRWIENWGFRCASVYAPKEAVWHHWTEDQAKDLYKYLRGFDLIISYNWEFDSKILSVAGKMDILPAFSMMHVVQDLIGYRLRLQNLSNSNGLYGTRNGLPKFLDSDPDKAQCESYNQNKIRSLNFLMDLALKQSYLNYWPCGETRSLKKMSTNNWRQSMDRSRIKF